MALTTSNQINSQDANNITTYATNMQNNDDTNTLFKLRIGDADVSSSDQVNNLDASYITAQLAEHPDGDLGQFYLALPTTAIAP